MADEIFELKGKVSIDTKSLDSAIDRLKTTLGTITGSAEASTSEVTDFVKKLTRVSTVSGDATENLDDLEDSVKSTGDETKKAGDNAKKSASSFQKLWGQLKRIAVYRAIRSVLKTISSTIKEGTSNLYEFAKITGQGTFASSMDKITTNLKYITNSLGTALAPIITALTPVIESLADTFAEATTAIARFFALLTGQKGYYKAIKTAKEYQKVQRQLLGFDELNVLNGNNEDNSNSFKWIDDFGEMSNFELTIQRLGLAIKEVVPENISPLLIGGAIVGAILGTKGIFTADGTLYGLGMVLSSIGLGLGFTDILPKGVSTALVGVSLFNIVKGLCGKFEISGGIDKGITAGLTGIALSLTISAIKTLSNAKSVTDSEFWKAWKQLAASAGIFTGIIMKTIMGATALQSGLLALTVGMALTLAIESVKFKTNSNAQIIDNELQALVDKGKISATTKYASQNFTVAAYGFANGGVPTQGSLFIAGEAGPELVSNIGGRTQVFNDTQLIGELSVANEGVIGAVLQAANAIVSSVNNIPQPSIRIGDREIYNASQRGSRIVGSSLVVGA